jgi:hypothetical protein
MGMSGVHVDTVPLTKRSEGQKHNEGFGIISQGRGNHCKIELGILKFLK